eukprot:Nitzschia sp. Nitz4//scaffold201_size42423//8478//10203//NITZ4_007369-RA/size42423-snap-gene-0.39-mRNA-1//-1//CDS//3329541317//5842//frame0
MNKSLHHSSLGVTSTPPPQHLKAEGTDAQDATATTMHRVKHGSRFFEQVSPSELPHFDVEEVELGEFLGNGEFGEVLGVKGLHVEAECPCRRCSKRRRSASSTDSNRHEQETTHRVVDNQPPVRRAPAFTETKYSEPDESSTLNTEEEAIMLHQIDVSDVESDGEAEAMKDYMCKHVSRKGFARYAVKKVREDLTPDTERCAIVDIAVEAQFLAAVNHPNIVKMRGTVGTPGTLSFMIVMDCLTVSLRQKMDLWNAEPSSKKSLWKKILPGARRKTHVSLRDQVGDKLLAMYDVARAMRYLHNHMIIFRDLKPENLGLDVRGVMRVFDFGLAKELKARDLVKLPDEFNATGLTGSRRYMAPEVALCKSYGLAADVYSFAIIFWEVFAGLDAFPRMDTEKHYDQVVLKGKRPRKNAASSGGLVSKTLLEMMTQMWSADPSERPSFRDVCGCLADENALASAEKHNTRSANTHLSDRSEYLMNRSLRSRCSMDSNVSDDEDCDSLIG